MSINLESMSLDELKKHSRDVLKAIKSFEDRKRKEALKAMEKVAKDFGLSMEDVVGATQSKSRKAKTPPKYRNPANPAETWSGRGRQPEWYKKALKSGKKEADLLI